MKGHLTQSFERQWVTNFGNYQVGNTAKICSPLTIKILRHMPLPNL